MNAFSSLKYTLKKHKKTWDDIEYIVVVKEVETRNGTKLDRSGVTKEDFEALAKDIEEFDMTSYLSFVGKDFYVTTDTEAGYFEFIGLPARPTKVINAAKMLLVNQKDENDIAVIMGLKYNG